MATAKTPPRKAPSRTTKAKAPSKAKTTKPKLVEETTPKPKAAAKRAVKTAAKKVAKADRKATHALAKNRKNPLVRVVGWLSEAADQPPLIAASIGTIAIGLAVKRADLARGGARMLASHLLATAAKTAIKHQIDRTRPGTALDQGHQRFEVGDTGDHEEKSFPSGHTAGAVAVALAASHDIEGAGAPAALATAAVAAAQAPTGHHYLSDVVVGGAVGWASEAIVSAIFDRWEPSVEAALGTSGA